MQYQRADIEAMVRQIVARTLGQTAEPVVRAARPVLDEAGVRDLPPNSTYRLPPGALVTPLARQTAMERGIRLESAAAAPVESKPPKPASAARRVALAADHGGYQLKEALKSVLSADYEIVDCGAHSADPVDYPDYAYAAARLVADGRAWRAIVIDGAGIGSCMAANKVPGVRAAMCYDQATAVNSREHNDANVLTLGAGLIGPALAQQIAKTWLATEFGGGRHARRVRKIEEIERRYTTGKGAPAAVNESSFVETSRPPAGKASDY